MPHLDDPERHPTPDAPHVRLPSLDALRAFDAAARLGSLERAGEALAVTASAVGKRLNNLEDLVGVALFDRGPKGLSLTAAGKEYLTQVRTALGLLSAMPLHHRPPSGLQRVRLCAPPTFARQILVPALHQLSQEWQTIELEVVLSTPYLDGQAPHADLEVVHTVPGSATQTPALMLDHVVPMASPALLRQLGVDMPLGSNGRPTAPHVAPTRLANWPLLRTPVEAWAPWLIAAGLPGHEPTQGHRLVDLGLTLEAAACGQGIALARPSLARPWLRLGALLPVCDLSIPPATQYCLRQHGDAPGNAAVSDWLRTASIAAAQEGLSLISGLG